MEECRLEIYVDDPFAIARGTPQRRRIIFGKLTAAWLVMGLPLAFRKAVRGMDVPWIGVQFIIQSGQVVATIPAEKLSEVRGMTQDLAKGNVIPKKILRTFAGKMQSVASLLFALRPYVAVLWAALCSPDGPALNCIWTSQVQRSLQWFWACFAMHGDGPIFRAFSLLAHLNSGARMFITTDASPFGIGGFVTVSGISLGFFYDALTEMDEYMLEAPRGDAAGQQCFEGLAALVTLRLWAKLWMNRRCLLEFRSDNMAALVMVRQLKGSSNGLRLLAQELSLDFAFSSFEPDAIVHTPGVQNVLADILSRKHDPAKAGSWQLPPLLQSATWCSPPRRDWPWWRSVVG